MNHNILLYIQNKDVQSSVAQAREMLLHSEGVLYTEKTPNHENMLWLEYDPDITSTRNIVVNLKNHGVEARMVGL